MAFRRKSFRRRPPIRRFRRRRMPNVKQVSLFTPRNIAAAARYAVKGVNLIKGIVNSEIHRFDTSVSVSPSTTAAFVLLSAIDQGDDVHQRQGNSILSKYITLNSRAQMSSSATQTIIRVIVFVDNDNDQQTPTEAELLVAANINAPINPDYSARFTVLYDKYFALSISGTQIIADKFYKKLDFHQKFITGTGSSGFGKSSIWLYHRSTEAMNVPAFNAYSRIAFYDN